MTYSSSVRFDKSSCSSIFANTRSSIDTQERLNTIVRETPLDQRLEECASVLEDSVKVDGKRCELVQADAMF